MKNTIEENELLIRLKEIADVIEAKRNNDDYRLSIDVQYKIEDVLKQIKVTYPTVKYPISLINGGCGTCFSNFIQDLIPVYDRLKSQAINEDKVEDDPDADFYKKVFELPEGTHLIEVKEPVVGSVEYNAKNVNEVNPFNPIGHDDVEEPKEVKAPTKRGRKAKGK